MFVLRQQMHSFCVRYFVLTVWFERHYSSVSSVLFWTVCSNKINTLPNEPSLSWLTLFAKSWLSESKVGVTFPLNILNIVKKKKKFHLYIATRYFS